MDGPVWQVIGGPSGGGLIVRATQDLSSAAFADRLSKGAVVREISLLGERLQYELLAGQGPQAGWVSLKVKGTDLLKRAENVWKVVGGAKHGGLVVRIGKEVESKEEIDRLSLGALVKQLDLRGERLHYELLIGDGPSSGWVTLHFKGKELLVKASASSVKVQKTLSEPVLDVSTPGAAHTRKLRVLALHGKASNSNIMMLQVAQLKSELGSDAEWLFLDAQMLWTKETDPRGKTEPSDAEKLISRGKPFYTWILYRNGWECIPEACSHLLEYIREQEPVDVIVAFSQASNVVSCLVKTLRDLGDPIPWKLNVFFSGGFPKPVEWQFENDPQPTVQVTCGEQDPYYPGGEPDLNCMYSDVLRLQHTDGHSFPKTQPRAGEIFARVALEVRQRCGCGLSGNTG